MKENTLKLKEGGLMRLSKNKKGLIMEIRNQRFWMGIQCFSKLLSGEQDSCVIYKMLKPPRSKRDQEKVQKEEKAALSEVSFLARI